MAKPPKKLKAAADDATENLGTLDEADAPAPEVVAKTERAYRGTQEVDHDLFKLEVARMQKNVSFTAVPEIVSLEHCHMFHTVDSNGKKQQYTSPVGGHFHAVTVIPNPKGGVPSLAVGPPVKWVLKKVRGVNKKVTAPVTLGYNDGEDESGAAAVDNHTHKATYLRSDRIKLRVANTEFAKAEAVIRAKQEASVEGVLSR